MPTHDPTLTPSARGTPEGGEGLSEGRGHLAALPGGEEAADGQAAAVGTQHQLAVVAGRVVDQHLEPLGLKAPAPGPAPGIDPVDGEVLGGEVDRQGGVAVRVVSGDDGDAAACATPASGIGRLVRSSQRPTYT